MKVKREMTKLNQRALEETCPTCKQPPGQHCVTVRAQSEAGYQFRSVVLHMPRLQVAMGRVVHQATPEQLIRLAELRDGSMAKADDVAAFNQFLDEIK